MTVSVDGMTFYHPVQVGQVLCCYGKCTRIGNSSMTLKLEVWVKSVLDEPSSDRYCVTKATFTYVAIDPHMANRGKSSARGQTCLNRGYPSRLLKIQLRPFGP